MLLQSLILLKNLHNLQSHDWTLSAVMFPGISAGSTRPFSVRQWEKDLNPLIAVCKQVRNEASAQHAGMPCYSAQAYCASGRSDGSSHKHIPT